MMPQVFQKSGRIPLVRRNQPFVFSFQILGKLQQVPLIGRTGQRTQPLFYAQVVQVLCDALCVAYRVHTLIICAARLGRNTMSCPMYQTLQP